MHLLLHGDHQLASRNFLLSLINQAKLEAKEIITLDGEKTDLTSLIQATTSNSLFGNEKLVIIENIFSRLKSKAQAEILDWLKNYHSSNPLIIWEKKPIGKVLQRSLPPQTSVREFKTPVLIFKLVEQLSQQTKDQALTLLSSALKIEPPEFIFAMIVRQIRLLLLIKADRKIPGAPWMIGKLKKQASFFTQEQLLSRYQQLYTIDKAIKTGQSLMPLAWQINLFICDL